ncbi:MerR family transcriptional regulator [Streptomyces gardneri]|uniref:MerR family transcriptional regulator n=1 Tax=Nocardia TaxID=1817 RepID=UPI00135C65EA|nr:MULTISPECIES: MerR family transcriptional regulator [Nocardia]MBF6167806.1 MerR family transcriptional regulator [Streptomyces gardneri]MBF6206179.1 MerR family transcriptional regulator [Streptomyces gardneri]
MRTSELARAAGTTPRAVRHYHRLGLLAEPTRSANGYRDYSLKDLARLMRIRWLAENGLPLGSVATVLAEKRSTTGADDLRDDLHALISSCEREITTLELKRQRLTRLLQSAVQGEELTALPADLVAAFHTVRSEASCEAEIRTLEREKDLLEVLAISSALPDQVLTWFAQMLSCADTRVVYRQLLQAWGKLEGRRVGDAAEQIELAANELAGHLSSSLPAETVFAVPDDDTIGGLRLDECIPDDAQRQVVLRALEILSTHPEPVTS